ncbi:adenylate/guanylate cyclase domain-containing protein [Opitutus sp. GAS368]|jgi:class 3 adenylate cyclase|uniref:adenylate/guanylate cyclase domain-containing protein n=1 Tax=Opitutus sp. GAS368 TaxID=1882749 RepID=UPI00087BAB95|nr:adenylate/guanylate cyclase domain-containing protein [Opitutus sp. GAS368]SDR95902.1 Adenylate cyclase, class 3 [Opitutus sp. GAS368]
MALGTSSPLGPGQRSLAAIVFTDVVSFSARMQADEETTLTLLQRDFDAMREVCVQHQGSVLKTTGDGLLLYFSSAVQAVACALAMQRFFAEQAKTRPAAQSLVHRLGIHLGDVFVNEQDVMGDGVNIAARLQAEAEPGGICISQTVYDVVKNKLALHVIRLSPRELKNISQHIPIYKLLLEAAAAETGTEEAYPEEPAPAGKGPAKRLSPGMKIALAAVLGAALAGLIGLAGFSWLQERREAARAEAAQNAMAATIAEATADATSRERVANTLAAWRSELQDQRSTAAEEYNFAELAKGVRDPRSPVAGKPEAQLRLQVLARMQGLFGWLATALQRYNRDSPLIVHELSGTAPKEIRVFVGIDRQLYYAEGGATRQRNWAELQPPTLAAIIAGALHDAQPFPPRDAVLGAQAFAGFYQLPELLEALRKARPKRPGK